MPCTVFYDKEVEEYYKNIKYSRCSSFRKKYFVICDNCFWMASTLSHPLEFPLKRYKKCPLCKNIDQFQIPNLF